MISSGQFRAGLASGCGYVVCIGDEEAKMASKLELFVGFFHQHGFSAYFGSARVSEGPKVVYLVAFHGVWPHSYVKWLC